jgi:hypothetical protein
MEWGRFYEEVSNRRVAETKRGDVRVSTVFLGLDHSFGDGPPLIFETMIFGGEHDEWIDRCSTYDEAEAMHERAVRLAWPEAAS